MVSFGWGGGGGGFSSQIEIRTSWLLRQHESTTSEQCDLAGVDASIHDVPEVPDWIQLWGQSVNSIQAFVIQEVLMGEVSQCPL